MKNGDVPVRRSQEFAQGLLQASLGVECCQGARLVWNVRIGARAPVSRHRTCGPRGSPPRGREDADPGHIRRDDDE